MINKKILFIILLGVLLAPSIILAQLHDYGGGFSLDNIIPAIKSVAWVIFGLIVVICFVMAGVLFLTANGEPEKIKTAKSAAIWGVVGVFVGILAYSVQTIIENIL